ncbi:MAG: gliding motility-associated protein GldM [Flavobacteriaceae bacterium]|jgi:gliding motility-associated protein GldM
MASGNASPRQKMINLMYLVFIAMLALNMSKEVLTAFGMMKEKFEYSNQEMTLVNDQFFQGLQTKAAENPSKFGPLLEKAKIIKTASDSYYNYLESLKSQMTAKIEDKKDYELMDRTDYLDQLFFNGDNYSKEGKAFIDQLNNYKSIIKEATPENLTYVINTLERRFSTGDENGNVSNRKGMSIAWLNYHYEGFPMVSSLASFAQMQSDIKTTEQEVLKGMLEGQLTSELSMTNYTTLLEQEKSAFYQGEAFSGSIVLGRKDATTRPNEVNLTLDGKPLKEGKDFVIEDGKVRLTISAGNAGDHTIKGNLTFLQDGKATEVPVLSTFATITKPNAAVISADKMNVVYRGLPNPMTISIPGVADNNVQASASGLTKVSGSKYVMNANSGREVGITATGKLPDGQIIKTTSTFRIKEIPKPEGSVRGETGTLKMPRNNLEIATIGAVLDDFDFDLNIAVSEFKVKIPGQPSLVVNGNKFDANAKAALKRASRGDLIQIFDIKAYITNNKSYNLKNVTSVMVELVN